MRRQIIFQSSYMVYFMSKAVCWVSAVAGPTLLQSMRFRDSIHLVTLKQEQQLERYGIEGPLESMTKARPF